MRGLVYAAIVIGITAVTFLHAPAGARAVEPVPLGAVILEDPLNGPGAAPAGSTCPTALASREFVPEGVLVRVRGRCTDTSTTAITGFGVPGLIVPDGEVRADFRTVSAAERAVWSVWIRDQGTLAGYELRFEPKSGTMRLLLWANRQSTILGEQSDLGRLIAPDDWNTLTVEAIGPNFRFFLNGQPALSVSDATHATGGVYIGLERLGPLEDAMEAGLLIRNLRVSALAGGDPTRSPVHDPPRAGNPGDVVLAENFDNPAIGKLRQYVPESVGAVDYLNGEYQIRRVNLQAGTTWIVVPGRRTDATMSVAVRLVGGAEQRYVGLTCRRRAAAEFYRLLVVPATGRFTLFRTDPDRTVPLVDWQTSPAIQRREAVNALELGCAGDTISASANGTPLAAVQDATYGDGFFEIGVGVFSGSDISAEARFDNLIITQR